MKTLSQNQPKLIIAIVLCFWFAQYVYIPYQTPYLNAINISVSMIGVIIGSYGISQLIVRLPLGILADLKNNHRVIIRIGAFLAGFASLIRIILPNQFGFLIGNVLSGIASATWISYMVLFTSYFSRDDQTKATSRIIMANNLGMLFGFVTSTFLYSQLGMTMLCLLSFIAGMTGFVISFFLTPPQISETNITVKSLLKVCLNKRLLFYSFLALVQQGIQMSTTMSFTSQIIQELGASDFTVGLSSIIYMVAATLFAKIGTTSLVNKNNSKIWIVTSFILLLIYCFLIPASSSITFIYLLQLIPGLATGILFSLLTSQALMEIPNEKRSTAMGLFQAIYAIGMTVYPMVAGELNEQFSMRMAYYVLGGTALVAGVVYLVKVLSERESRGKELLNDRSR